MLEGTKERKYIVAKNRQREHYLEPCSLVGPYIEGIQLLYKRVHEVLHCLRLDINGRHRLSLYQVKAIDAISS